LPDHATSHYRSRFGQVPRKLHLSLTSNRPLACRPFSICPLCRESTTSIAPFSVRNTRLLILRTVANLSPADVDSVIRGRLGQIPRIPPFGRNLLSKSKSNDPDALCAISILSIIAGATRKLNRTHHLPEEEPYFSHIRWEKWASMHGMVLQQHIERYIWFKQSATEHAKSHDPSSDLVQQYHTRAAQEAVQMARIFLREVQVSGS
jgi:hypothetical protein